MALEEVEYGFVTSDLLESLIAGLIRSLGRIAGLTGSVRDRRRARQRLEKFLLPMRELPMPALPMPAPRATLHCGLPRVIVNSQTVIGWILPRLQRPDEFFASRRGGRCFVNGAVLVDRSCRCTNMLQSG